MKADFAREALSRLSAQEKAVLRLKCQGLKYQQIALQLQPRIKLNTVKAVMSHVYDKLGLTELTTPQRWEALYRFFCPVLSEQWVVMPPEESAAAEAGQTMALTAPDDLEPASPRALVLVSQDDELDPDEPPQLPGPWTEPPGPVPPPRQIAPPAKPKGEEPKKPNRLGCIAGGLLGGAAGLVLGALALWLFLQNQAPPRIAQVLASPTGVATSVAPPPAVTATPAVATVIVVVTATPPPVTDTPEVSETALPATNTPTPSDTSTPTQTPTEAVGLPFSDDFNNQWNANWQWTAGSWATKGGALTTLPGEPDSYLWFYLESDWQDLRVTIRVDNPNPGAPFSYPAAVAVRYAPGQAAPLAFVCHTWNCGWGRPEGSDPHYLQGTGPTVAVPMTLKIEVKGNLVSAFINGAEYQTYALTDLPAVGGLALGARCPSVATSCPLFDDLNVEPLAP
jgi:DNA-binding CsgD family transcriptional regulator